jgi:DNA-binding transcriptional LysR family regulator
MDSGSRRKAVTRRVGRPGPDTIRLWTLQHLEVWERLRSEGVLTVDPGHPDFCLEGEPSFREPYDWMREQMTRRVEGYAGHYPWWAYEHFLDLRRWRFHSGPPGTRMVRLGLAIATEQALLSGFEAWHYVLNRWYLPAALDDEEHEREQKECECAAALDGVDVWKQTPLPEPWESRLRASWERIFDVDMRRSTETIQATFEFLWLDDVVTVTDFTAVETANTARMRGTVTDSGRPG